MTLGENERVVASAAEGVLSETASVSTAEAVVARDVPVTERVVPSPGSVGSGV